MNNFTQLRHFELDIRGNNLSESEVCKIRKEIEYFESRLYTKLFMR